MSALDDIICSVLAGRYIVSDTPHSVAYFTSLQGHRLFCSNNFRIYLGYCDSSFPAAKKNLEASVILLQIAVFRCYNG